MTHIACHINALQLSFGACTVPLTFTLPAAGCTLIGRNGIGKSLLLELLAGQRRAASGKIEWLTPISWLSQFAPAQDHDGVASVADLIGWGEPDNHLDHPSRQLLTQVLADYSGTLLLVSHAPDFVGGVGIERVYWLRVEVDN